MGRGPVSFSKMSGLGNEILVIDMRGCPGAVDPSAIGALRADPDMPFDQIMSLHDSQDAACDARIEIFNSDGSAAGACGNGMRCVAALLAAETGRRTFLFQTVSGMLPAFSHPDGQITVGMGHPRFGWREIPLSVAHPDTSRVDLWAGTDDHFSRYRLSVVNVGNPHAIIWTEQDVRFYTLEKIGPLLEQHSIFSEGANISVARVETFGLISIRTWERGVGLTKACGSAACATCACAARLGLAGRTVHISMPGGSLAILWDDQTGLSMTGTVSFAFSGLLNPETGQWNQAQKRS